MLPFLLLGLIQGLTEFLPISSSGHLVLAEAWLGVDKPGLLFDALIHLGTVGSVLIYYRARVGALLRRPLAPDNRVLIAGVAIATLPGVLAGLALKDAVEAAFASPLAVAGGLCWTGAVLWAAARADRGGRALAGVPWWGFVLIGVAQSVAFFPGVSRSGMTVAAALALGLRRETAAEFSFLLAIPAILGATALQLWEVEHWNAHAPLWPAYAGGALVALLAGVLAIGALLRALRGARLRAFSLYCWALALGVLLWVAWG